MSRASTCPIWGTPASIQPGNGDFIWVESPRTTVQYVISGSAEELCKYLKDDEKARLTSWLINQSALGEKWPKVDERTLNLTTATPPLGIRARRDRLMLAIKKRCRRIGDKFRTSGAVDDEYVVNMNFAAAYSESFTYKEAQGLIGFIVSAGFAFQTGDGCVLSFEGETYLESLKANSSTSDQAFVAMWFSPSMSGAYAEAIAPAIIQSGYRPLRIDQKEHANKIDDEIVAEIRNSRFIVADFTSESDKPRGGVYFEAGFAMGLNKPVIWTCREDMINQVHFDTRQFNHITWTDMDEFKSKLKNRIGAVIGAGPLPH